MLRYVLPLLSRHLFLLRLLQKPSKECEPYASIDNKPIAPCGAIANSMFNGETIFFSCRLTTKREWRKHKKMTVSKWLWSQIITDQFVWTCLWRTHVSLISRLCFLCRHFEAVLQRPQRHKCPDPADVHRNCLVDGQTCEVQEPCRHQLKPHGCFSRYRQSATSAALPLSEGEAVCFSYCRQVLKKDSFSCAQSCTVSVL